jgi:hypothetical protein
MKFLKVSTLIILVLLFVSTLVLISFQSIVSIIAVPTGILLGYYLLVLLLIGFYNKRDSNDFLLILIWSLFLIPIISFLLSPEGLFNLITPKIILDMK